MHFFFVDFTHSWDKLCIILFYSCKEFEINGLLKGVVLSMCICLCRSGASRFFMKVLRAAPAFLFSKSSSAVLRNTIKFLVWEVSSREFWVCLCYVSALCRLFKVSTLSLWFISLVFQSQYHQRFLQHRLLNGFILEFGVWLLATIPSNLGILERNSRKTNG